MLKLSIIVPVYNVEKYLPKCIDSLICGDGGYEIILINDGSTDGSPDILADYAARYPALIRIITTPNGGLGHARNTGIDAAMGGYLLFVDSDDYLSPDALGSILAALDDSFDICIFDILSVNESGKVLKKIARNRPSRRQRVLAGRVSGAFVRAARRVEQDIPA